MPRTKKPAGQAVNPRNGRRHEVQGATMARFSLPKRANGQTWRTETRRAWAALWDDGALSGVLLPVDRPVLLRWVDAVDRASRYLELGDAEPIAEGSMGQQVESPYYGIADKALRVAKDCEAQLGIGALHRARLGIAVLQEKASLVDLNARIADAGGDDDDDPR